MKKCFCTSEYVTQIAYYDRKKCNINLYCSTQIFGFVFCVFYLFLEAS